MKGINYVAGVTQVYRNALDCYSRDPDHFLFHHGWLEELKRLSHRDYTTGFALGTPSAADYAYATSDYIRTHELLGVVTDIPPSGVSGQLEASGRWITLEVRNRIACGERVEFVDRNFKCHSSVLMEMTDQQGNALGEAHPGRQVLVRTGLPVGKNDLLRRRKN